MDKTKAQFNISKLQVWQSRIWKDFHLIPVTFDKCYPITSKGLYLKKKRALDGEKAPKVAISKNLQFWSNQVDILSILPNHKLIILTKFHKDRAKIVDFLVIANFWTCKHFFSSVLKWNYYWVRKTLVTFQNFFDFSKCSTTPIIVTPTCKWVIT